MKLTFDQSKDQIAGLVKHFAANRANYLAPQFNEAQARQEFIDPLFICLGWDIRNENAVAPQYREVIVEESLDVAGHRKSPLTSRPGRRKLAGRKELSMQLR